MRPYTSIDIETTGLNSETCKILEIGAVIDNWVTPVEKLPSFHCYVLNREPLVGEAYAFSMHPTILRRIATREKGFTYLYPYHVAIEFKLWLERHEIDLTEKYLDIAGKNFGSFDNQFLKKLPDWKNFIKSRNRIIDPGNLYWNPKIDNGLPSMETCMERAGIPGKVTHSALEDALIVVKLIRHLYQRS